MTESMAVRHSGVVRLIVKRHFMALTFRSYGYAFEDLVQEGLYAVMRAESNYNPAMCKESTYCARVAYNWIASRVRQRMRHARYRANMDVASFDTTLAPRSRNQRATNEHHRHTLTESMPDPARPVADAAVDRTIIEAAMDKLKRQFPNQYTAVVMRYYGQYYTGEIAQAMGCSQTWASSLARRGIANLREYMQDNQGGQTA